MSLCSGRLNPLKRLRVVVHAASTNPVKCRTSPFPLPRRRQFNTSSALQKLITQKFTDVGEGTKEAEIIQWFVEEGARIEEWGKLCEVTTDKASVEITSKYSGIIKKLHVEQDKLVQVGQPLVDIEAEGEEEDVHHEVSAETSNQALQDQEVSETKDEVTIEEERDQSSKDRGHNASLATPAVRGLLKEHGIEIQEVTGSGKGGRVMKEDVLKFISQRESPSTGPSREVSVDTKQVETPQRLTPVQSQMFRTMTASLTIPHFLYSDTINITRLSALRKRLNDTRNPSSPKISYLPFTIKAVSLALNEYPILNAKVDLASDTQKPQLIMRASHNIGIAMDTPSGLLVPVIKNVNARSIKSISSELRRLSDLGQAGKLSSADLSGGTITVSNIGNIGGDVVAPIIVEGQVAIMGMGKVKPMPIFGQDGKSIEKADMMGVSWSADHRIIDGATMARAAKIVQGYLEEPDRMVMELS